MGWQGGDQAGRQAAEGGLVIVPCSLGAKDLQRGNDRRIGTWEILKVWAVDFFESMEEFVGP